MAKFCGKCGAKLDETTGLCPNCDAEKLAAIRSEESENTETEQASHSYAPLLIQPGQEAASDNPEKKDSGQNIEPISTDTPLTKKEAKKQRKKEKKAAKKAKKKAKRAGWSTGKKIRRFLLKSILLVFSLAIISSGIVGALVYFDVVDIPAVSHLLILMNIKPNEASSSLTALDKGFTDISIVDPSSAVSAAQDAAASLGYKNAFDELMPYTSTTVGDRCFYRLQQYHKGIPVYGRYVTVIASKLGESLAIMSDCLDIDDSITLETSLTDIQVQSKVEEYAVAVWGVLYDEIMIPELSDEYLVIYDQNGNTKLAYQLNVVNGNEYTVVIDAKTGDILESVSSADELSTTGTNVDGSLSFPVEYDEDTDTYTIGDSERNIYVFNLNKNSSKKSGWNNKLETVESVSDNIFGNTDAESQQSPEIAINLLNTVEAIADYYDSKFGQNIPFGELIAIYKDGYCWGKNALGGSMDLNDGTKVGFLSVGYALNCTELDVLAHEYTHIVARQYDASIGSSKSSGAINEGLADTFACFYTGDWDIDLSVVGGSHRNASDPGKYKYPASINDKNRSGEDSSHGYATVVSHAAYLMSESKAFSGDELPILWYETMTCLPHNCSFYDLRFVMEKVAVAGNYTLRQRNAISKAFDEVGITNSETYNCSNTIFINTYDKNGNLYDDYKINIEGKTSGRLFGIGSKDYSLSVDHKTSDEHIIELENGKYTIYITDNASEETVNRYEVSVKKANSVENLYAFDYGADYIASPNASMTVLDVNKDIVSDYSATAFWGDESFKIQGSNVNLAEQNYYNVLLSQRNDAEGVTYYCMFSLRTKDGQSDEFVVDTNFDPLNTNKDTTISAPQNAVEFNGHYYYVYDVDTVTDWDMAQEYCEEQGGYLATITSAEEDAFVYSYIVDAGYSSAMFGLSDQDKTDDWRWVTGESFSYQNWRQGEPNHQGGYEHYGMYYERNTDGTWNDGSGQGGPFICEWGEYTVALGSESVQEPVRTTSDERDIVLVLDVSGSMAGTPMEETKKASVNFIDSILDEDASIGIVTYDNSASRASDFSVNKASLENIVSGIYDGGGTNIEAGLREAHSMLSSSNAKKKIIVLMSDGEPNDGKEGDALVAYADEIKGDGVLIYTLGFFENMGGYKSSAQQLMERIASDGCHYEVANADDLVFFFGDIADQLNGQKYIYVRIACPVDVSVTYQGQTLNSAEDDLSLRTDFGTLTFEENEEAMQNGTDDRIKVLRLKEGTDYDLRLTGTGHGLMDYTIGFMDDEGNYSDLRKFEDIKITKRTVIDTVAATSKESILNIDENGDGKYDLRLRAGENGYGEEIKQDYLVYIIIGSCAVLLLLIGVITAHNVRTKKKGKVK